MAGETRLYLDDYFESDTGYTTWVRYYYFGGQRVAMRTPDGVTYLHGDHLGSTSETTGQETTAQLYFPYGAQRTTEEVAGNYRYTGQRWEEAIGLYDYKARYYDPYLNRWIQPDSIVPHPGNPQSLNRFAYCLNNPLRYTDPTGHWIQLEDSIAANRLFEPSYDAFGVRYTSDNELRVLYGGQHFVNQFELELANSVLSGGDLEPPEAAGAFDSLGAVAAWGNVRSELAEGSGYEVDARARSLWNPALWLPIGAVVVTKPYQDHHLLPYANSRWTYQYEAITQRYGLNLRDKWNIVHIPQRGSHPTEYHQWALETLQQIDAEARGDRATFLRLFEERIASPVVTDPDMLDASWWR